MIALLAALLMAAEPAKSPASDPAPLVGAWVVDLTADPAKPYLKGMELNPAPDGTVAGTFYDHDIEAGRWRTQNGRTCASFRTSDQRGPYHTAVCRVGASLEGQTWAEARNFVFVWSARPATEADRKQPWW